MAAHPAKITQDLKGWSIGILYVLLSCEGRARTEGSFAAPDVNGQTSPVLEVIESGYDVSVTPGLSDVVLQLLLTGVIALAACCPLIVDSDCLNIDPGSATLSPYKSQRVHKYSIHRSAQSIMAHQTSPSRRIRHPQDSCSY